ncbi:MAG: trypsin-like peptidase domain-containing protein [Planctomycetota bacterium]|nr:trypsin-like peptidase domain-containing protein [Planctomycetota bacterium]
MKTGMIVVATLIGMSLASCTPPAATEREGMLGARDFREVVRLAKESVFPAVVYVKCLREEHSSGKKITSEVTGSGVLITADGEVLTNWHVVDKAVEVRCLLADGRGLYAKVLGKDKDTDLALLKLERKEQAPLPFAPMGTSATLNEGDFVMAMGAPWGLNRSVSIGIISCTRRYLPESSEYSIWMQTDAAINPGNSGGPLVNTAGQIVGINTRGGGNGMGFAIPSDTVQLIVSQLREFGEVNWSWTGLKLQPLKDFDKNTYFDGTEGVLVASTDPDSPAREAGIQTRDLILKINGVAMTGLHAENLPDVRRQLALLEKNKPATVEIRRGEKTLTVPLTPRRKGKVQGEEWECQRWDMTVKTINKFENEDLYFYRKEGLFIYGVKHPGNASEAGLQEKDILVKIDATPITTLDDVRKAHKQAMADLPTRHKAMFTVMRDGLARLIVMDYSRDYEKE